MKTDEEMTNSILQKYQARKRRRHTRVMGGVATGLSLAILCGAGYAAFSQTSYDFAGNTTFTPSRYTQLLSAKHTDETQGEVSLSDQALDAYVKFSGDVFANYETEKNTLFSPLSLYMAVAILTEGAAGTTREQLCRLLGLEDESLWEFALYLYRRYAETESFRSVLAVANSIWLREAEEFTPDSAFLDRNALYFGAEIYKSNFSDATVRDMNAWVKAKTHGQITEVVKELADSVYLMLFNTVAMKAEWVTAWEIYTKGTFTKADGTTEQTDVLSRVVTEYYDSGRALAFSHPLEGGLEFMGILPNAEEENYVLDGAELTALFAGKRTGYYDEAEGLEYVYDVHTVLPKFQYSWKQDLVEILQGLGVTDAFDARSDFSGMGTYGNGSGGLSVQTIEQKTTIELNKDGVAAAAVTSIGMEIEGFPSTAVLDEVYIVLDRPFYYVIYDKENQLPIFMGFVAQP